MKLKLTADISELTSVRYRPLKFEAFNVVDPASSAALMVDSYMGSVDWEEGDNEEVATAEILKVINSEYGEYLPDASFTVRNSSSEPIAQMAVAAIDSEPTILFIYTHPSSRGEGLASSLIRHGAVNLQGMGYQRVSLYVSELNPALRLYLSLGFGR